MWKLRHWLHSSLPDSFFLSFFFFPSLSLPVPRRCVSLALFSLLAFFLPPLPCLRAWEHCRPLSSQFPFLTSSATSSVYAERGFLLHRHRELSNLKGSRRAHIFSHICFFPLSLSLFPQDFPFVSPSPLRLRFLPSETRSCFPCCAVLVAINS